MTEPGWHYAPGDPAGMVRYWDGANWHGEPQEVAQTPASNEIPARTLTSATVVNAVAPGWQYAQGDPAGTVRYWDGSAWQGDAVSKHNTNDVIHYIAPEESALDLGGVASTTSAVRTPTNNYAASPYSVTKGTVNVKRRRRIPKLLSGLVSIVIGLKLFPLLSFVGGLVSGLRDKALYDTSIVRSLTKADESFTVVFLFVWAIGGALLLATEFTALFKERIDSLAATSALMVVIDLILVFTLFPHPLTVVMFVLQLVITIWAFAASSRDR